jgi:hypothetical protein
MNKQTQQKPFSLRTFVGGQSDYEDKGIKGSFKAGANLSIRKQKDTLSCGYALVDDLEVGTMTAPNYFTVPASDGKTYFFTYDGKIFRRNPDGTYLIVAVDSSESGHIIGAAEWYDSTGYTYLLWATPTRLNIKRIKGPGYTNTEPWNDVNVASSGSWPKTNLTSTDWHTMCIANGALQITNGNLMALVGYDLSYTNQSLRLIPGNDAKCVLERGKYGITGCTKTDGKDETTLFSWDGIGLSWNDKQIIKFGGLNSMIDTEVALMQIGTEGQLYISDFNTPMPFRQIRGGGESNPDGVTAYHGMALIGIFNNTNMINGMVANGIYSVGRVNKNAPFVLNLEYQLDCDEIYSVKTVGTDIFVAYGLNGEYGVKIVDPGTYAQAVYQSLDLVTPASSPLGRLRPWSRIDLECEPLPPGTKIECWYKVDKATSGGTYSDGWIQSNTDIGNTGGGLQFQGTGKQNAVFYLTEKGRVLEVMLVLIPSGNRTPEVNEINVY